MQNESDTWAALFPLQQDRIYYTRTDTDIALWVLQKMVYYKTYEIAKFIETTDINSRRATRQRQEL
ncbi:MAG: hypothetical protein Q7T74_02820, partial [Candidatus Saccharibacteria bacterium]|nr:hypothetical protein [Candidatus Saccharibacteria bacterium]